MSHDLNCIKKFLKKGGKYYIVYATWCIDCKALKKKIGLKSSDRPQKNQILGVNWGEEKEMENNIVDGYPTIFKLKGNKLVEASQSEFIDYCASLPST
jgi:thiol-disulfide isomerase/thioredoxin